MNLEQIVTAYKDAKKNKHDADMAFMQVRNALVGALKDSGVAPEELSEEANQ